MKHQWSRKRKTVFILILFICSFVRPKATYQESSPIRVGVFEAPGYFETTPSGYSGYGYQVLKELANVNGYEYDYVSCALKQCFELLANKEIDLLHGIHLNTSREKQFAYTRTAMGVKSGVLFVRDSNIAYGDLSSFQDLKIGLLLGDHMAITFIDHMVDAKVSLLPVYKATFEEIIALYDIGVLDGFISADKPATLVGKRVYEFGQNYTYFITYLGNDAFLEELDAGLAILRSNGIVETKNRLITSINNVSYVFWLILGATLVGSFAFSYYVLCRQREQQQVLAQRAKYTEISSALKQHHFFVVYQPIVDIRTHQIAHVEALIRWNHETKGLLSPYQFLEDVATSGLMFTMFVYTLDLVLNDYVTQFSKKLAFAHPDFHICINITYSVLTQEDFIVVVEEHLYRHDCPPSLLCFEVTEQMIHDNVSLFNARLAQLRQLGCKVAMDDFGIEYSSLLSLKQSDYDIFKIDKYFIDEILTDKTAQSIASAVIAIGRLLQKNVIAEGVESAAQVNLLYDMECYLIQGYFFSRPYPLPQLFDQINDLLARIQKGVPYVTSKES